MLLPIDVFDDVSRHRLTSGGEVVQVFDPELTQLQLQVLELLHVPADVFGSTGSV